MDILKILKYALEREIEGKKFFLENADRLHNAAATHAFKTIANEEQRHIEFIQAQILAHSGGGVGEAPDMKVPSFLSGRAASEEIEQSVSESMVADLPVLRMAYLIERDFAEFYESSAKRAEGESKKVLEMLAKWESGHEKLFKRLHDDLFEKYTDMPWGG